MPTAQQYAAAAPALAATGAQLAGTSAGILSSIGATSAGASAAGAMGAIAAAAPWIAAGAAVLVPTINLLECGTISQVGCQKRSETQVQETGLADLLKIDYAYEIGEVNLATAQGDIQQTGQNILAAYHAIRGHNLNLAPWPGAKSTAPAAAWQNGNPWSGIPNGSQTAQIVDALLPSQNMVSATMNALASIKPGQTASGAAPSSVLAPGQTVASAASSTAAGSPSWLGWGLAAAAVLFLVLK